MSRYRQFETLVSQRRNPYINQPQLPPDVLPINFKFYKLLARAGSLINEDGIDLASVIVMQPILVTEETINVDRTTLLSDSTRALVGDVLSSMLVPEHGHPAITEEVFHKLAGLSSSNLGNANNTTMLPIFVGIIDLNLLMPSVGSDPITSLANRVAMSSMQTYEAKPIPADESSIENLEKVIFGEEGMREQQQTSCVICMEDFEDGVQVSRLPCLHFYHEDCIGQWLKTSHLCPLCRYPMPHA